VRSGLFPGNPTRRQTNKNLFFFSTGIVRWRCGADGFFEGISFCRGITSIRRSNEAPAEQKKKLNMKTKILLGAAIAAFTFTSFAADALLSPRAAGNQNKIVSGLIAAQLAPASASLLTPRAGDNQIKTVTGVVNDSNPALACRNNMNGTPKIVAECTSHTTMPGCMTVDTK
jgi:hypothetical protein